MSNAKADDAAPPPKKKGKLFLIIGIVVLVLAIGGAAAAFLLMKKSHSEEGEDGEEAAEESHKPAKKAEKGAPPVFVRLDAFTVRLQAEGTDSYLQAVPELRVIDAHVAEDIKAYMPEIRHKTLLVIAAKKPADVSTPIGVQQLSNELRVTINGILSPPKSKKKKSEEPEEVADTAAPDDPVQAVLFTSFIVQ
jgi:flagellar protein FliL